MSYLVTILVSIYVLVILIAVIASRRFAKLAVTKGYAATKAKKYPLVIGAFTCFLMMFGQTVLSFLGGVTDSVVSILFGWSVFVLGLFLVILFRAFKNMKAAPDAGQPLESDSELGADAQQDELNHE